MAVAESVGKIEHGRTTSTTWADTSFVDNHMANK